MENGNSNLEDQVKEIVDNILEKATFLDIENVPNIGLYMDQVLTLLGDNLTFLEDEEGKKALTKTMINNYSKNHLLPSPEKKKYTKDHIILLTFIYYYKSLYSIGEIKSLINPVMEEYFGDKGSIKLSEIYDKISKHAAGFVDETKSDIEKKLADAKTTFEDIPEKEAAKLQLYSLISSLSYDIYIKKHLVEELINNLEKEKSKDD